MNNRVSPEVLAVVPLPSPEERKRREVMLARVMLVAIDIVLAGELLGLETSRDLRLLPLFLRLVLMIPSTVAKLID